MDVALVCLARRAVVLEGKKSEHRQDRRHKEPIKKQDEPIQVLVTWSLVFVFGDGSVVL